jgi:hypothetical protein
MRTHGAIKGACRFVTEKSGGMPSVLLHQYLNLLQRCHYCIRIVCDNYSARIFKVEPPVSGGLVKNNLTFRACPVVFHPRSFSPLVSSRIT